MRRWTIRLLTLAAILVAAAALAAAWLLGTAGGARFALGHVVDAAGGAVRLEGVDGRLLGGLRVAALEVATPAVRVLARDVELDALPLGRAGLAVRRLAARSVEVRTVKSDKPASMPPSFRLPWAVRLDEARVAELRVDDLAFSDVALAGVADASGIHVASASVRTPWGDAKARGTIDTERPFRLEAQATATGVREGLGYEVAVEAKGSLAALEAALSGQLGGTRATAKAAVEPFAPVPVRSLTATVKGLDLSKVAPKAPRTALDVEASLVAGARAWSGPVKVANAEPGPIDAARLPFSLAEGLVTVSAERVEVTGLRATLGGGGHAEGRASVERGRIEADLKVAEANVAAIHGALKPTRLAGTASIVSTDEGQRFVVDLRDPRFAIEGRGAFAAGTLTLEAAKLSHAGGSVSGAGSYSTTGSRAFRFEGRAEHFDPSAFAKAPPGDLNFALAASGALSPAWSGEAAVELAPSRFAGLPAGGTLRAAGDGKRLARAEAQVTLGEARLEARGALGAADDALDVALRVPNLSTFAKLFGVTASGQLDGKAHLAGSLAAPAGRIELAGTNLALPGPVNAPSAKLVVDGTAAAHRATLEADLPRSQKLAAAIEGGLDAASKAPSWAGRLLSLSLTGPAAFALAAPAPLAASAGRVELGDARIAGDWGEARFEVTRWTPKGVELKGSSPRIAAGHTARALGLPPGRRSDLVMAAEWDVRAGDSLDGKATLRRLSGDLRVGQPSLDLGLQEASATFVAARGRIDATLDVVADRVGRVQGRLGFEASEAMPLSGTLVADVPTLERMSPWLGQDAKLAGRLRAEVAIGGSVRAPTFDGEVRAEGLALREPASGFEIEQGELAVKLRDRALAIERLEAVAPWRVPKRAAALFVGAKHPDRGRITASGTIDLGARTGAIVLKAEAVPVTQTPTRFVEVSGEARLSQQGDVLAAGGALRSDFAWIGALATALPSVSEDVVVVRAARPAAEEAPRGIERIALDLRGTLGDHVHFQGRGLDTRLTGSLRLAGDVGALKATGAIRTTAGTYEGYGQKLAIERGTLTFTGPLDNPALSVLALRKGLAVEAGVEVYGSVARPRVRLVSRPDVPEPEKLSWLVLGRSPAQTSQADAGALMATARAMLGENDPSADLVKRFGFDEVRVGRPDAASALGALPQSTVAGKTATASAGDAVSVGKQLTKDVHVLYEQGLADAEGSLRIAWQITQKFQLLLRAGYLPGVDAVYRWTFE